LRDTYLENKIPVICYPQKTKFYFDECNNEKAAATLNFMIIS